MIYDNHGGPKLDGTPNAHYHSNYTAEDQITYDIFVFASGGVAHYAAGYLGQFVASGDTLKELHDILNGIDD